MKFYYLPILFEDDVFFKYTAHIYKDIIVTNEDIITVNISFIIPSSSM